MEKLEQKITAEEKAVRIAQQQGRCDDWKFPDRECKAFESKYCPRSCAYAINRWNYEGALKE